MNLYGQRSIKESYHTKLQFKQQNWLMYCKFDVHKIVYTKYLLENALTFQEEINI